MAARGIQFPWRWHGGTISSNLDSIWGISVYEISNKLAGELLTTAADFPLSFHLMSSSRVAENLAGD